MIIIGIDPGTAKMGCAIIKASNLSSDAIEGAYIVPELVEQKVLITSPEIETHHRLKILFQHLNDLVDKHSPDVMVIEKLFFNTNVKTAINVAQARGVSMLVAANYGMTVQEYTALEAKLCLTGYGRSDKKQMQEAVKTELNLDSIIKPDDANDAVAIALCYLKKLGQVNLLVDIEKSGEKLKKTRVKKEKANEIKVQVKSRKKA